jgi:hypothetical protein
MILSVSDLKKMSMKMRRSAKMLLARPIPMVQYGVWSPGEGVNQLVHRTVGFVHTKRSLNLFTTYLFPNRIFP